MIVHKGKAHLGEHKPIVDEQLFEQVQTKLADNASGSSRRMRHRQPSLLTGRLFDGDGRAMTPSHASRPNKRYRYYVTRPDQVDGAPAWRVPAHDLEQLVCRSVAERLGEGGFSTSRVTATLRLLSCSRPWRGRTLPQQRYVAERMTSASSC